MSAVEFTLPWREEAACRGLDPGTFFPDPSDEIAVANARHICLTQCGQRVECLRYARETQIEYGIWGGVLLDGKVRRRGRRGCTRCGSRSLFRWNGQIECTSCGFSWAG